MHCWWTVRQCSPCGKPLMVPQNMKDRITMKSGSVSQSCLTLWVSCIGGQILYHCATWEAHVQLFVTLWTTACQFLLSMEFSRQEYWNAQKNQEQVVEQIRVHWYSEQHCLQQLKCGCKPRVCPLMDKWIRTCVSRQGNIIQSLKGRVLWCRPWHGWPLRMLC